MSKVEVFGGRPERSSLKRGEAWRLPVCGVFFEGGPFVEKGCGYCGLDGREFGTFPAISAQSLGCGYQALCILIRSNAAEPIDDLIIYR